MPGNRRHIPAAVKQQWVTMSAHMSPRAIAQATHTSYRTVNRVLQLSRLTGAAISKPLESGRPRLLTAADVSVSNQSSSYVMYLIALVVSLVLYRAHT
jgi:hypothetical protein